MTMIRLSAVLLVIIVHCFFSCHGFCPSARRIQPRSLCFGKDSPDSSGVEDPPVSEVPLSSFEDSASEFSSSSTVDAATAGAEPVVSTVDLPHGTDPMMLEELQPDDQQKDISSSRPSLSSPSSHQQVSRRDWLRTGLYVVGGCALASDIVINKHPALQQVPVLSTKGGELSPVNLTKVVQETRVNITVHRINSCVCLDHVTFQKKQYVNLPSWVPQSLVPSRVIKDVSDQELLIAAVSAGTIVEMARTSLLYPLLTLKTRIQTDINTRQRKDKTRLRLKRRLQVMSLNAQRHFNEGDLYAGLLPSLLVTAPATGLYYGMRDVIKRTLTPLDLADLSVSVVAALVASIFSIALRTPIDALSTRLQVATGVESSSSRKHLDDDDQISDEEEEAENERREERISEEVGGWFDESLERLPVLISTDVPYLLLRVVLNGAFIHGTLDVGRYELFAISTAILSGIVTTPFDVARTRILVDSDGDPTNGVDGGSKNGLRETFQTIVNESDDGVANLFRGWLERALYLGIGRAWLEPLQIVGYIAIRDAILLEWFD